MKRKGGALGRVPGPHVVSKALDRLFNVGEPVKARGGGIWSLTYTDRGVREFVIGREHWAVAPTEADLRQRWALMWGVGDPSRLGTAFGVGERWIEVEAIVVGGPLAVPSWLQKEPS